MPHVLNRENGKSLVESYAKHRDPAVECISSKQAALPAAGAPKVTPR
jgi:hypothetical protein